MLTNRMTLYYEEHPEFRALYNEVKNNTVITPDRLFMLWQLAKTSKGQGGLAAEVGMYKGGSFKVIYKAFEGSVIGFDTFTGLPAENKDIDLHHEGDFNDATFDQVQEFLSDCPNALLMRGKFPETAEGLNVFFNFVHIDGDLYQTTKDALEYFYPRMLKGGIIVFDDYGWSNCPGVNKAIEEFLADKAEIPIALSNMQCFIIKQ